MDYYETVEKAAEANQSVFGYKTLVPEFEEDDDCCGGHHHEHHHGDGECTCGGHGEDCDCDECDGDCDCDDGCCGAHAHWRNPKFETLAFEHKGLKYFVRRWGKPQHTPVLMLHGFMQTSDSWWTVAPAIAQDHCVYAMDLLGHGGSDKPADASRYTLAEAADAACALVSELIVPAAADASDASRRPRVHVAGYSLGGRVALGLMERCPGDLNCLVLESASLGPSDDEDRAAYAQRSASWAAQLREKGMEAFVDEWEQLPLFATQQRLAGSWRGIAQRAERVSQDPLAMALVLEGMGQHTMPLKTEAKGMLAGTWNPICYLFGNRDEKYSAQAHDFAHEGFETIGVMAGHNVHLENPEKYVEELARVLRGNEMRGI